MSDLVKNIMDADFNAEVIQSDRPVLVDFWAEWCGPCKMIAPVLDKVAAAYEGKLSIVKINIDENPKTPMQFGVRGIPTLLMFKGGDLEDTKVGALTESQLRTFIDKNI